MTPPISICLPIWNAQPFLEERLDTIRRQTFLNWELLIYDSQSTDGSWELIKQLAESDNRIRIMQGPREGLYAAWNHCLCRTAGDFVYIATGDDTMAEDFCEKMLAALQSHPDCEIAHCPLTIIDSEGRDVTDYAWPECTIFSVNDSRLAYQPHVRRAPFDGLLHLTGRHVYLSITQLLICRSLFRKIGGFSDRWSPVSDFNWEMKAGLAANLIHVPQTWASWRMHDNQASATFDRDSDEYARRIEAMIAEAISSCRAYLAPEVIGALDSGLVEKTVELRRYYRALRKRRASFADRRTFQISQLLRGTTIARSEIFARLLGEPRWPDRFPAEIRLWLESHGLPAIESA